MLSDPFLNHLHFAERRFSMCVIMICINGYKWYFWQLRKTSGQCQARWYARENDEFTIVAVQTFRPDCSEEVYHKTLAQLTEQTQSRAMSEYRFIFNRQKLQTWTKFYEK